MIPQWIKKLDEIISIEYGVLPELLQMTLMMADTQGILGSELLNHFGYILSLPRKELLLCKLLFFSWFIL